jgi:TonB-linked SusC/RagA family outer membrane protein
MRNNSFSSKQILFSMLAMACMSGNPLTAVAESTNVQAVAQTSVIKGQVVDANGEPIIGASVVVKGTTNGTITDLDGKFSLNNAIKKTLEISYIGYKTLTVQATEGNMRIVLKEDTEVLEEVVVVGYGTQKKATLTGAVASVGGDVLESRPVSNTAVGLQGQIPGLTITRTSSRPGNEDLNIQLRGASSVNSVSPLIIIDGVPAISNTEFSSLNPSDIENISVLKDASAAIYGSRAAGGVILVTTKKGKKGEKVKVTYNGMLTANTAANMIPLADMKTWANAMVDATYQDYVQSDGNGGEVVTQRYWNGQWWFSTLQADGKTAIPNAGWTSNGKEDYWLIDKMAENQDFDWTDGSGVLHHFASNNWLDLIYGTTLSTQHNLSVQGSSERARWMASLGYANDRSVITAVYDGAKKYSARLNVDFDLTKWLTLNTNMSYNNRYVSAPRDGLDGSNSGMYDCPAGPAYTPSGDYYDYYVCGRSPLSAMKEGGVNQQEFETFRYSNTLTAKISKDFDVTGTWAFIKNNNVQTETKTTYYVGYWDGSNQVTVNPTNNTYVQERIQRTFYENYLLQANYHHTFGGVHNVAAMVGANAERNTYKNVTAKRTNLLYEGLTDLNTASSQAAHQSISGGSNQNGYVSYLARVNYDFAGKYMVELLGRRDGTSKFHPDYRWSNFGAGSIGWRISEENFLKEAKWLNNLKIRASYGVTGGAVSSLGNYDYLATMNTTGTYYFSTGLAGTGYLGSMTDYSRTWEKLHNLNIGLDFAVLGNRLSGSFDWYRKTNDGMLVSLHYPDVLGATAPATNSAKLRVNGWEAALNWNDKVGQVEYWVGASLANAKSKVTDYSGTDVWTAGMVSVREGYPLNSLFVYKTDGYFTSYEEIEEYYKQYANCTGGNALGLVPQSNEKLHLRPGDRKKVLILDPENDTTDGKGNTGAGDVYYYGDTDPHYTFSVNMGAKWKNWDFSMFWQGVGQHYIIRGGWGSNAGMNMCAFYRNYNNILTTQLDTWTWDNQNAQYARLSLENNKNNWNMNNNDSSIQNAWYARLKNITLGYTLPKTLLNKWGVEKIRLYLSGDNVCEFTGVKDGYDPEKSTASRTSLPFTRSYTFGLDLTF